ncbi:MAG: hypothetical protein WAV05_10845 [Anaerolineales bacterium]
MLNPEELKKIYAARYVLDSDLERTLGVQIPFDAYLQDPLVAEEDPMFGFDKNIYIQWEPGLADGPTSARFAVVDYNGDTGTFIPPAKWNPDKQKYEEGGKILDRDNAGSLQFHQVNAWVAAQRALRFYQEGNGLGRTIPWGFEGNRLIILPHAGYCENAFYDRHSKSLQFYYFGPQDKRVYTCLSTDIINHEFGHAILDGVRPHYLESNSVQAAAFHEFIGDMTAILILLRNNEFRKRLAEKTQGNLNKADQLAFIAEEFGRTVKDRPYLRNAREKTTLSEVQDDNRPHYVSQVLTGAMYKILVSLSEHYLKVRNETPLQAYWNAIQRMQHTTIQPLDLLPPVDVTFKDYALAVLRYEELTNPKDPYGYFTTMLNIFKEYEILDNQDVKQLNQPDYLYKRLDLNVYYDIRYVAQSRSAAYDFLNDNRKVLYIPTNQDFLVSDLYDAYKLTREGQRLPREIVIEYIWQEEVKLDGREFGALNGKMTSMLCGGTLVYDEFGTLLSWSRKPGTQLSTGKDYGKENIIGWERRSEFLSNIAHRVKNGQIGIDHGSSQGFLGSRTTPLTMKIANGIVSLEMTPHMSLEGDDSDYSTGGRKWQISF